MTTVTTPYQQNRQRHSTFPSAASAATIFETQRLVGLNPDIVHRQHDESFTEPWIPETLPLTSYDDTTTWNGSSNLPVNGSGGTLEAMGQEFQIAYPATIDHVQIYMSRTGSPTDGITCDLVTSASGSALATVTVNPIKDYFAGSGSVAFMAFYFTSPVHISRNTTYLFRLTRTGARDVGNKMTVPSHSGVDYAGGREWTEDTGVWQTSDSESFFRIYGVSDVPMAIPLPMYRRRLQPLLVR